RQCSRIGPATPCHVDGQARSENPDADQLAGRQVPPCVPRPPAKEIEYPAPLLVTSKHLDHRAERRVEHQVEGEQLAEEPLAAAPVRQEEEDERAAERFVELRRV